MEKIKKKEKLKQKLLNKYRLVILKEDNFEERLYISLTRLNVVMISILLISIIVIGTVFLIAFTPLKEYMPGYSSTAMRTQAVKNTFKLDSITESYAQSIRYFNSIQKVILGDIEYEDLEKQQFLDTLTKTEKTIISNSIDDSILRKNVDQESKYNFSTEVKTNVDFLLFPPAKGNISQKYSLADKHFAVDIALVENSPIKSIAEGTVIFSEWTANTGYVIIIEHPNRMISSYKHNASLSKEQGDFVKAGEVIATAGNTGEFSTGWHLHFELWNDGYPMNPEDFIDFFEE